MAASNLASVATHAVLEENLQSRREKLEPLFSTTHACVEEAAGVKGQLPTWLDGVLYRNGPG